MLDNRSDIWRRSHIKNEAAPQWGLKNIFWDIKKWCGKTESVKLRGLRGLCWVVGGMDQ